MKKQFVKVLSLVMALMMVVGAFSTMTFAAEHVHTKGTKGATVAPTCIAMGYTTYTCAGCGELYPDDFVQMTDHKIYDKITAATCKADSQVISACSVCKKEGNKILNPDGTVPAAVKYPSKVTYEAGSRLKHELVLATKATNCVTRGYTYYKCNVCGQDASDEKNNAAFRAQVMADYGIDATHDYLNRLDYAEPVKGHDYVYTFTTAAETCKDGVATGVCSVCNYKITVTLLAPHSYVYVTHPDATCSPIISGFECELCGDVATKEEISAGQLKGKKNGSVVTITDVPVYNRNTTAHQWADYNGAMNAALEAMGLTTSFKLSTCAVAGYDTKYCSECKSYKVVEKALAPHTPTTSYQVTNDPENCVQGKVRVVKCSVCNYKSETVVIAPVAHKKATLVVAPVCGVEGVSAPAGGYTITYCENCTMATTANGGSAVKLSTFGPEALKAVRITNIASGYVKQSNYTDALTHTFGEWSAVKGNCTADTGIYRTRECTACEYVQTQTLITKQAGHNWSSAVDKQFKLVEATCIQKSYYATYCVTCAQYGATFTNPDLKYNMNGELYTSNVRDEIGFGEYSTTKHDYTGKTVSTQVAPKCNAVGKGNVVCNCGAIVTVDIDTVDCVAVEFLCSKGCTVKATHTANRCNGTVTKDFAAVAPKCNVVGYTQGQFCKWCLDVKVDRNVIEVDIYNGTEGYTVASYHRCGEDGTSVLGSFAATCTTDGYTAYNTTCCGVVKVKTSGPVANAHTLATKEYKAAACGKDGNHGYTYCKACGEITAIDITSCNDACGMIHAEVTEAWNTVIPAIAHNWSDTQRGLDETCTVPGYTAYKYCLRCDATSGKTPIPAHGSTYKSKLSETKPTCTADGITKDGNTTYDQKNFDVCTKCKVVWNTTRSYVVPALGHRYTKDPATLTNNSVDIFNATSDDKYDCTLPYFEVKRCVDCNTLVSAVYSAAKNEHTFETVWNEIAINKDGYITLNGSTTWTGHATATKACAWNGGYEGYENMLYKFRKCIHCGVQEIKDAKATSNHYVLVDGVKKEVTAKCTDIANYKGMPCAACNGVFDSTIKPVHNIELVVVEPTCAAPGYTVEFCKDCQKAITNVPAAQLKHVPESVVSKVDPVGSKDGKYTYKCKLCGENYDVVIEAADVTFDFVAENTLVPGSIVVNSGMVSLVVKTSAAKVGVNTIGLEIGYDMHALEFVDATVLNTLFANRAFAGAENGIVTVAISAPNSSAGKIQDVALDGEGVALVKLNFKVLDDAIVEGEALKNNAKYGETSFWCKSAEVYNKDGKAAETNDNKIVVAVNGKRVANPVTGLYLTSDVERSYGAMYTIDNVADFTYTGDYSDAYVWEVATVKYYAIGDVNMDGPVAGNKNKVATLDDAIALVKIWNNESELGKYSAAADIDKDGAITVADYEFLMMYITGEISYAALLNKGVEPEEESGKMEVTVGPNGEIIIKPVA